MYRLFLVEDETVTREGIRQSVNWADAGFQLIGDAPDGEAALPLILDSRPDIVITDIKMPFMDGLELTRILKEQAPEIKIIILSGHDEFEYAQRAIPLEVIEYLLKPVTRDELLLALQRAASQLDLERQEQDYLLDLLEESHEHQELLQERLLLRLIVGGIDTADAVEQSKRLQIHILAPCYLVMALRFDQKCGTTPVDYAQYHAMREAAVEAIKGNPDILWFYKDLDELVLIIKGDLHSPLANEAHFLSHLILETIAPDADCRVRVGIGTKCERLTRLNESYAVAAQELGREMDEKVSPEQTNLTPHADFPILTDKPIERLLHLGAPDEFDAFFDEAILPLQEAIENSQVYRNYVFTHLVFTCVHFIKRLGGNAFHVLKDLDHLEERLVELHRFSDFKTRLLEVLGATLAFRDEQVLNLHTSLIWEAKAYLKDNFQDPGMSLQTVADHVSMSTSHFSRIFSQEAGETFIEFLTGLRIERAKQLLSTTAQRSYQIAESVGYNDPHYFSAVFKRMTGLSPSEYRERRRSVDDDAA